jgi:predicted Zn-dependent protease
LHQKYCFKWISIDSISLFYVYDHLFEDFVFWHGHMNIVWGHEMMGCMLLLMPLTSAQGKSQYQCKWTKTCEILIAFNEKRNNSQILKIITHDIMIPLQNFILLNQQVQNTSLPTIYMSYTKFHPDQLETIYGCLQ